MSVSRLHVAACRTGGMLRVGRASDEGQVAGALKKCGALALTDTAQRRDATEHFHASTLAYNETVCRVLEDTRKEDEEALKNGTVRTRGA